MCSVEVVEKGAEKKLTGSTGYAREFVRLFDEAPVPTELARDSAARYDEIPAGFTRAAGN
ncbi:hypothetical protein QRX50_32940 [Amycolatopsis carbonis]|uniref:Uncharacterized protein n=1 Tax=Amycolatopsis carbonis TaxID=715471 RepID=A0A9Y2MPN3_9PSEU|nr:hypothetical protein [Amycolatopsis sp. 2-15]WIX76255.1 hypothetical protein QRX50_32940 [Amycolatopsis sp. 2-15]